ncbi:microcin C transport system substrate-binding protein [Rhodobacter viridis]|uniref:Microcin C transport system substrate-binding protein n=1 Tax=Rhodobacter viridis TaxID=1054202 RepID=A0A318TZD8_9RHOB|nr:extracellular solute-binding protein [Rhodobacter viridis]PYF10305.1 microcin C transport system substrate-binding protein [Rhodobacter viridis]
MAKAAVRVAVQDRRAAMARALGGGLVAMLLAAGLSGQLRAEETITAAAIATLGTVKYPPDFKHLDYVNPEAPKGGEISEWTGYGFDNFNPYTIEGRAAPMASAPQESMLTGTADTVGEAYCLLCESFEYPPSRDWVIFTLRPGITFSDGTPLTIEDVLFSYETMRDKGLSSFRAIVAQQIASVEVLDARRIKFTFKPDYPRRDIIQSAGGFPVFSKAQFARDKIDLEKPAQVELMGSGPYMLDSFKMGQTVVWKRNPAYWGETLPINLGRNNFDRIRVEYYGDYQSAFEGFKAGSYTFRNEASSIIWATQYDFPALKAGHVVKAQLPDGSVASGQAWAINLERAKFQDIRVRQALGLMFNFDWSNETLFYGLYKRINSPWENSDLAASGPPSEAELALLTPLAKDLPEGVLTDPAVLAPVSGKRQLDRGNMRKAAALLEAAGWVAGDDGMRRNAKGELLHVEFINDDQSFDRVINPFVENLRALGVDAVNFRVDDAQYQERKSRHDFDLITGHFGQELLPGAGLQQYFGSGATKDAFNLAGIANPAIDALIRKVEEATTKEELAVRVHALDRALRALYFWVPQWFKDSHTVAYYDMYEHPAQLPPYSLGELDFWWYNADKAAKLKAAGAL